jgi:hypothetical protein
MMAQSTQAKLTHFQTLQLPQLERLELWQAQELSCSPNMFQCPQG